MTTIPALFAIGLQQAVLHPLVTPIAKSAGIVDNNDFMVKNYIVKNIKKALTLAQKTLHKFGRTNDDLRSFVQSVVLSQLYHLHSNRLKTERMVHLFHHLLRLLKLLVFSKLSTTESERKNKLKEIYWNYGVKVLNQPELYFLK